MAKAKLETINDFRIAFDALQDQARSYKQIINEGRLNKLSDTEILNNHLDGFDALLKMNFETEFVNFMRFKGLI